jgi:CPA2 family monovalent cation:H+ antiporter-2
MHQAGRGGPAVDFARLDFAPWEEFLQIGAMGEIGEWMCGGLPALLAVAEAHGAGGWIDDFGMVLAAAGVAVAVFHLLRLPVIFGYILTGLLIGPHIFPSPLVEDLHAIQQISELGVIFLLFFIGMEFDLKRLQRVLGPAFVALLLQTLFMLYLAHTLSAFMGWNPVSTIFFGSLLAISSSMVTVRVLRESGRLRDAPAQFTIGILILEDVLAVILLVILTGVALTKSFDWDAAWLVTFLMGIFVVMAFVIGRALVPRLLVAVSGDESKPEVITMVSVGLVMGVSMLALRLDFSPALGAFIAGTMLSQTQVAARVEHINRSLHDVFSAVFFVAIGMQIDPFQLIENLPVVLLIACLLVLGKVSACWLGLSLAGQSGRTAFLAAVPKAQIGEFSFIIAGMGGSLGVMDPQLTNIAFGVALLTILMTPANTALAERTHRGLARMVPSGLAAFFSTYQRMLSSLAVGLGRSLVLRLIQRPVLQILIYFCVINGIFISASFGANRFFELVAAWPGDWAWRLGYWLVVALLASPFLLAVLRNLNAMSYILADALFGGHSSRPVYQNRFRQMVTLMIFATFMFALGIVFLLAAAPYLPNSANAGAAFLIAGAAVVFLRGRLILVNSQMELLFIDSFKAEVASKEEQRRAEVLRLIQQQAPWPVEINDLTLPAHAAWSGRRIRDLDLRARFGVTILALGRGYSMAYDPSPDAPVFSGDRLVLTGTPAALEQVAAAMQAQVKPEERPLPGPAQFRMEQVYLGPDTGMDGETLAGARVRQRFGVTVIGVQRGDERIQHPAPDFLLHAGDVLLVAGLPEQIEPFAELCSGKPLP